MITCFFSSASFNVLARPTYRKCNECNRRRKTYENHQICRICYKTKTIFKPSGNKVIDDFIKYTQTNLVKKEGKLEFVPYDRFKNIEFIAEGGFSKIYKATWTDGPISNWDDESNTRIHNYTVALKRLNDSRNITSKELNELKVFYNFSLKWKASRDRFRKMMRTFPYSLNNSRVNKYHMYGFYNYIGKYFGITQDPNTKDIMIVMPYYSSGDLIHYISNVFYEIYWEEKLRNLVKIIIGLMNIHSVNIIHRDFHSGNIFFDGTKGAVIGDLGISKSATESTDENNENYGIIPYMAPEIFQGQKYTKASDIYSFGMVMWELMTGRRPFWDRNHDTDLIIDLCDGLRPPIVTNAPEGYIELMKECWHSDPQKRPQATDIYNAINEMFDNEWSNHFRNQKPTEVTKSPNVGPITVIHQGAVYKSRPLSGMIQSAMISIRSRTLSLSYTTYSNNDYCTKEFELDIEIL
ncbi:kinase-like domain-containing protein [Rhizophagus clarus]|uniref:Kinase-like domain-containing protein n=1 Tax=Rhizophagus clarus TaxID=94130 RepID=A0A8H3MIB1_9GLOM|nr:kinase-like domain-containing protein [Rhizophagus clarus]